VVEPQASTKGSCFIVGMRSNAENARHAGILSYDRRPQAACQS
jgi:hypothetical protein